MTDIQFLKSRGWKRYLGMWWFKPDVRQPFSFPIYSRTEAVKREKLSEAKPLKIADSAAINFTE